jgi:signal transduction histidine kinase
MWGGTVLTIGNDGQPVPGPDRERIFERFVRLDESRAQESGGSGLGLAIAAGIMAAHHGTVRATETPDGNCRFELAFPPATPGEAHSPPGGTGTRPR